MFWFAAAGSFAAATITGDIHHVIVGCTLAIVAIKFGG